MAGGSSCDSSKQRKRSSREDEPTGVVETAKIEGNEEISMRFSREKVDDWIKVSLEPLFAQISTLTEKIDRLIQSNLTKETTTASSRGTRLQHESPYSEAPGCSRFPTVAPVTTAGYWSDSCLCSHRYTSGQ